MPTLITFWKNYVVEPSIRYFGYPAIDWDSLLTLHKVNKHATFDISQPNNAWNALLLLVRNALMQRPVRSWGYELRELENTLLGRLPIKSQKEVSNFQSDLKTFRRFIYFSLNREKLAPYCSREVLAQPHTQELLQCLIRYRLQAFPEIRGLNVLLQQSNELNALVRLIPSFHPGNFKNSSSPTKKVSFFRKLNQWFNAFLLFFKKILVSNASTSQNRYQHVKAANNLWDIRAHCGINKFITHPEMHATLQQAYQKTLENMKEKVTPHLDHFLNNRFTTKTAKFFFNLHYTLEDLHKAYASDLESLTYWGEIHYRRAILLFQSASDDAEVQGIQSYLAAYQITHHTIENLSSRLFDFRNQLEKLLRNDGDNYLENVNFLNAEMLKIEDKLTGLQNSWLKHAERLTKDPALSKASECLAQLLTPEIKNLKHIAWAEHTAYCSGITEEPYAFEIEQRTRTVKYHLETTQTQSDYLLFTHWQELYRDSRPILALIHPDKFQAMAALLPIARFCTEQIVQLRERAEKVRRMWGFSQWYDASKREADALHQEDERLTFDKINGVEDTSVSPHALETKIEVPHAPEAPLTLNILRLNQRYQNWAAAQLSLKKRTTGVEIYYCFYPGPFDKYTPLVVTSLNFNKQQYPGNRRRMNYLEKEYKEKEGLYRAALDRSSKYQEEIAKDKAAREEAEMTIKRSSEALLNKVKTKIIKSLDSQGIERTSEGIINRKSELFNEVYDLYSGLVEDEQLVACVDECVGMYLTQQTPSSTPRSHVSFFAETAPSGNIATTQPTAALAGSPGRSNL